MAVVVGDSDGTVDGVGELLCQPATGSSLAEWVGQAVMAVSEF